MKCAKCVTETRFRCCTSCRARNALNARRWRERNPEQAKLLSRHSRSKDKDKWNAVGREIYWPKRRYAKYGLTKETWEALFDSQGRRCAVCKSETPVGKRWHTDHNHVTNKVRGILCHNCNVTLGLVHDSVAHLNSLVNYLQEKA